MSDRATMNYFLGCRKPKEAAKCAGISERTLKSWYGQGLPFIKVNDRLTLINGDDLKEFMESKKQRKNSKNDKVSELLRKTIGN